jgi:hypothetical protein
LLRSGIKKGRQRAAFSLLSLRHPGAEITA